SCDEIRICTGYRADGREYEHFPYDFGVLDRVEPIYETFERWNSSTSDARPIANLPPRAPEYVHRLEELTGVPVAFVSVGTRCEQVIAVRICVDSSTSAIRSSPACSCTRACRHR